MDVRVGSEVEWGGLTEVEPLVRGWLWRRCRDQSDVDDVVQETLLRAARYRGGLERPERLASWALSIAANTLRDRHRARPHGTVGEVEEFDLQQVACDERAPDALAGESLLEIGGRRVANSDALDHLRAALRTLRAEEARMLLDYYDGLPIASIAERLGVRAAAVKCRLYRARRRLARELELRLSLERRGPCVGRERAP